MQTLIHLHICIVLFNKRQGEYGVIARLIREYFLTFHFACCNMEYFPLLTCTKKFLLNMSNEVNQFLSDISLHFVLLYILKIYSNLRLLLIFLNIFQFRRLNFYTHQVSSSIIEYKKIIIYMKNVFRKCQVMVKIFIQFFFRNKGMEINKYREIN